MSITRKFFVETFQKAIYCNDDILLLFSMIRNKVKIPSVNAE